MWLIGVVSVWCIVFFFQAEDGIRDLVRSRGLGDVYKRQDRVLEGFDGGEFDAEGRYIRADFGNLSVISLYLPSGSSSPERQEAKFRFLDVFFPQMLALRAEGREIVPVSYTHLRAHETVLDLVCRLLLEKKKNTKHQYHVITLKQ